MSNSTNFSALSACDIDWHEHKHYHIAYIEIAIEVLGILMNLSGIIALSLKQKTHKSIFHKLVIFLAVWALSYLTFSLMTLIVFFQESRSRVSEARMSETRGPVHCGQPGGSMSQWRTVHSRLEQVHLRLHPDKLHRSYLCQRYIQVYDSNTRIHFI